MQPREYRRSESSAESTFRESYTALPHMAAFLHKMNLGE